VFAFDDDFALGVLCSRIHTAWAVALGGTFEDRPHYTHTTAFETFPWPDPTVAAREMVAEAGRCVVSRRQEICFQRQFGLTQLYNEVEEGAYRDLAELHITLDDAVASAYGWPTSAAHDTAVSKRLLLELNRAITEGEVVYEPF
jgi:hypothetical protein